MRARVLPLPQPLSQQQLPPQQFHNPTAAAAAADPSSTGGAADAPSVPPLALPLDNEPVYAALQAVFVAREDVEVEAEDEPPVAGAEGRQDEVAEQRGSRAREEEGRAFGPNWRRWSREVVVLG
ncbi:hypothetical protein VTH06DRAFT_3245 [Thermothelomyces fergusii]